MAWDNKIPFKDGKPVVYVHHVQRDQHEWRDNYVFAATMRLSHMNRGRSAAHFIWEDDEGVEYVMFMSDMVGLIKDVVLDHGVVAGKWTYTKKGQNFGIKRVE